MNLNVLSFTLLIGILALPTSAFAYLDPGTGSAILQGIIGALAAIAIALKLYWHRVLRFLGIRKKTDTILNETLGADRIENRENKTKN